MGEATPADEPASAAPTHPRRTEDADLPRYQCSTGRAPRAAPAASGARREALPVDRNAPPAPRGHGAIPPRQPADIP
eukprot:13796784-Alexandrium_andersonii.AAC.1